MKRSEVEKYLGKKVKVTIFDGDVLTGYLCKTGDEIFKSEPNLYIPRNYYFTVSEDGIHNSSYMFRSSHITKIKEFW